MYTQENRQLRIDTQFGEDALLLRSFTAIEALSRPFCYSLELSAQDTTIQPKDLVGIPVSFQIQADGEAVSRYHGHIVGLSAGASDSDGYRGYSVEVRPWLWFLTKRSDCRIFQGKTVLQIAEALFSELGFSDYESRLEGQDPLDYCVQYRETDFDFLTRLLSEHGIYYFFRHEEDRHILILADSPSGYDDCPEGTIPFARGSLVEPHITEWRRDFTFVSGKFTHTDYSFEEPSVSLEASAPSMVDLPDLEKYEVFEYPGKYPDKAKGDTRARLRIEREESGYEVAFGASTCAGIRPGSRFTLQSDSAGEESSAYVVTSVEHSATDTSYDSGEPNQPIYSNSFRCVSAGVAYRPPTTAQKPVISGLQSAVVTGPAGEEIHTDEYGRVKVQFHWDREGVRDENSSCWIRVAQSIAGKKWGTQFIPRLGQEVLVAFLEGDPDRPVVIGSVYNAEQPPTYEVPSQKGRSGVRTRSTKGGGPDNANEITFVDEKGSEELYFHAEKDHRVVIENDHLEEVGKDHSLNVGGGRELTVSGDQRTKAKKITLEADTDIEIKAGEATITLKASGQIEINGTQVSVSGAAGVEVKGTPIKLN